MIFYNRGLLQKQYTITYKNIHDVVIEQDKEKEKKQKGSQEKYYITTMPNFYVQLSF